jgi:hypothetical protein
MKTIQLILIILFLLIYLPAKADIISLQNDVAIHGNVLSLEKNVLEILENNALVHAEWNDINDLTINNNIYISLNNGETFLGQINIEKGKAVIHSETAGTIVCQKADIKTLALPKKEIRPTREPLKTIDLSNYRAKGSEAIEIGEKPEKEDTPYLREAKILLEKGKFEIAAGVTYIEDANDVLFLKENAIGLSTDKVRQIQMPFSIRYGIKNDLMASVVIPFVSSFHETDFQSQSNTGLGDIGFGLFYQLKAESIAFPSLTVKGTVKTNTGESSYDTDVPVGNGHWNFSGGFSMVKTYDPVALFGGMSYTHTFERSIDNQDIDPGDNIDFIMGLGFAVNKDISMSFQIDGAYFWKTRIDNRKMGIYRTPLSFTYKIAKMLTRDSYIEPAIQFGLNDDATDVVLDFSYVKTF